MDPVSDTNDLDDSTEEDNVGFSFSSPAAERPKLSPVVPMLSYLVHAPSRFAVPPPNEVAVLLEKDTVAALIKVFKAHASPSDWTCLGLSSMSRRDLQRHVAGVMTAPPLDPGRLDEHKALALALSPLASCSDQQLLTVAQRRGVLPSLPPKKRFSRLQLLAVLHFLPESAEAAARDRVTICARTERHRCAISERCLTALDEAVACGHVGPARAAQEARLLLSWTRCDALAHDVQTVGLLLHRTTWLHRLSSGLVAATAPDIVKHLLRHVIPFLMYRPDLILSHQVCWETMGIDKVLTTVALPSSSSEDATPTRTSFFASSDTQLAPWLESDDLLREPQRLALLALRSAFSVSMMDDDANESSENNTSTSCCPDDSVSTLMALRSWFCSYLYGTYTQPERCECAAAATALDEELQQLLTPLLTCATPDNDLSADESATRKAKLVVLPTGVGKSRVICLAPFVLPAPRAQLRVLVLCPSVEIRSQMAASMLWIHRRQAKVVELTGEAHHGDIERSDVCVSTVHQLAGNRLLKRYRRDLFQLVLIDEAHHAEAPSYRLVREHFHRARYVYFTGTPHRSDGEKLRAELVYQCTMRDALLRDKPYVKHVCYLPLPVASMTISCRVTMGKHPQDGKEGDGKLSMRLESFADIVAFANDAGRSRWITSRVLRSSLVACTDVMRLMMVKLCELRAVSGVRHQAILQAADTTDAGFMVSLWRAVAARNHGGAEAASNIESLGSVAAVHSQLSEKERAQVLEDLRADRLDAIVHVGMLGEGFDHPQLSVCGIFCRFSSLPPFVQLVGRILRRIPGKPNPGDSFGYVIAHPALGIEPLWQAYKQESPAVIQLEHVDDVIGIPAPLRQFDGELALQQMLGPLPGGDDDDKPGPATTQGDWFLS